MPLPVVAAVLLAAFLHAAWNAVAHAIADRLIGFALIGAAATAGGAVLTLVVGAPAPASWPYLAVSAALHVGYSLLLLRSYELGEFGQAYPLARGTSPWLVAIGAAAFAHETLTPPRLAGVAVISVGLASLVFAGRLTRADVPAIGAALLTGVTIAAYTTVDGLGVRHAGGALGYAAWLFIAEGAVIPLMAMAARLPDVDAPAPTTSHAGLAGGVASIIAYGLVLWAQTRGALAPIAALRETSVIIGAIIGAVVFRERFGRWRIVATVLVAGGVALINV